MRVEVSHANLFVFLDRLRTLSGDLMPDDSAFQCYPLYTKLQARLNLRQLLPLEQFSES